MMFPYDMTFVPPAPALDIIVISPVNGFQRTLLAKLDTASDGTIFPISLADDLDLEICDLVEATPMDSAPRFYFSYFVDLIVAGRQFIELEAIAAPIDHLILGRDVLNQLLITLDDPQLQFELR